MPEAAWVNLGADVPVDRRMAPTPQFGGAGTPAAPAEQFRTRSSTVATFLLFGRYVIPDSEFDRLMVRVKRVRHSGIVGAQMQPK